MVSPANSMALWAAAWLILTATPPDNGTAGDRPYRNLAEDGAGFFGPGREQEAPAGLRSVRLGVFGPAARPAGQGLRQGVQLAVEEANARGGYGGLPFEVIFRADDGPWGMGAKQVTALAYEDSVWAILGGLEGSAAHLAELIAAKVWIPVITPTAADLSIDYANVPWVFRCFPSDAGQARSLLGYARRQRWRHLVVFVEADRDGRNGLRRLEEVKRRHDDPRMVVHEFAAHDLAAALLPVDLARADGVLIWSGAESGLALLQRLREGGYNGPVLGPARLLSPRMAEPSTDLGEVVVAAPYDLSRSDTRFESFRAAYRKRFSRWPEPVALYAYDATTLLIAAIAEAGLNRARIRDALAAATFAGVTGTIRFDGLGGAQTEPVLMRSRGDGWRAVVLSQNRDGGVR